MINFSYKLVGFALLMLGLSASFEVYAADTLVDDKPAKQNKWITATSETGEVKPDVGGSVIKPSNKNYLIPAAEIVAFDILLNQFNRRYSGISDYDSNFSTSRQNLKSSWRNDNDAFEINQLGHPYQGSIYYNFARSAGFNYWESLGYTLAGSAFWEIAGEKVPPSKNDMISTGIGGSFLGEALFRMSNIVLEKGGKTPSLMYELGAAAVSPSAGFNRWALEDKIDAAFTRNDANYYSRVQIGVSNILKSDAESSSTLKLNDAQLDFSMDYGLPGQVGYSYSRPFDYFVFQATASSANVFENVMTRGLLYGTDYQVGDHYRGLWGLYGRYDYISPQTFRVSSTALSLGTTGQLWLSKSVALQGSILGGLGYAAVGSIKSSNDQDYHYGVAPQGLVALRLIFENKASIDFTGREYFVSDIDKSSKGGHDNILRTDVAFTYRVHKKHGVALKYQWNQRDATYPEFGDKKQTTATLGIFYTYLGHDGFGETDWR